MHLYIRSGLPQECPEKKTEVIKFLWIRQLSYHLALETAVFPSGSLRGSDPIGGPLDKKNCLRRIYSMIK